MISTLSIIIGSLLGICAFVSLCLNGAMFWVIARSKLIRANPIYVLSALNLLSDCLQNAGILLFLAPTSIAQSYLLAEAEPNRAIWIVFMFVFQISYYSSLLILIAISFNRLIVIVFPTKMYLIDRDSVKWISIAVYPLSLLLSIIADYLLPCCRTNYSFATYSFQFFAWNSPNMSAINYKNYVLDLPLNIGTTLVLVICYGIIFYKVVQSNRKEIVRKSMLMAKSKNNRMSEVRYAIQFALISAFFIAAWVSFRIFPAIVSNNGPEWYSLTAFFLIANSTANALIYLTMNQEVKNLCLNSIRRVLGMSFQSSSSSYQPSKVGPASGHAVIAVIPIGTLSGTIGKMGQKPSAEQWATRVGPNGALGIGCVRKQSSKPLSRKDFH